MSDATKLLIRLFTEYPDCSYPDSERWPFVGLLDVCAKCGRIIPDKRVKLVRDETPMRVEIAPLPGEKRRASHEHNR